jgi:hypothetical protein
VLKFFVSFLQFHGELFQLESIPVNIAPTDIVIQKISGIFPSGVLSISTNKLAAGGLSNFTADS